MDDPVALASAKAADVRAWFRRSLDAPVIKTPEEIFHEKYIIMEDMIDREVRTIMSLGPSNNVTAARNKLMQYGGQAKELEQQHAANAEAEGQAYQKQVEEQLGKLLVEFTKILGSSIVALYAKELMEELELIGRHTHAPETPSPEVPAQETPGPSPDEEDTTEIPSPEVPTQDTPGPDEKDTTETQQLFTDPSSITNQNDGLLPEGDITGRTISSANDQRDLDPQPHPDPQPHHDPQTLLGSEIPPQPQPLQEVQSNADLPTIDTSIARKRPASPPAGIDGTEERSRANDVPHPPSGNRCIEFEDVFQGGNAEIKYTLALFPRNDHKNGQWYILECKEHSVHFTKDPIHGAAKHLSTPGHGNLPRKHELAVGILGTRVLNCDSTLAAKNNSVAQAAFAKGLGMPSPAKTSQRRLKKPRLEHATSETRPMPMQTRNTHPHNHNGPHTRSSQAISAIDPRPGEIYAAYWKRSKNFFPVLILPWGSFHQFGWKESLADTGLLKQVPPCYIFDQNEELNRGWAEGYEDDGPLVLKREYPVIYFDRLKFPQQSSVGWVLVTDLKPFDPNDMGILYRDTVAEFMQSQEAQNSANHAEDAYNINPEPLINPQEVDASAEGQTALPETPRGATRVSTASRSFIEEALHQDGDPNGTKVSGNSAPTAIASPATRTLVAKESSDIAPDVTSEQPTKDLAQQLRSGGERGTAAPPGNTDERVWPANEPRLAGAQSSRIPPTLMPEDEDLAYLAAQAVVAAVPEILRDERPVPLGVDRTRERTRLLYGGVNGRSTGLQGQPERNSSINISLQADPSAYSARRGSGFFDAVLGPPVESLLQTTSSPQPPAVPQTFQRPHIGHTSAQVGAQESSRLYSSGSYQSQASPSTTDLDSYISGVLDTSKA